MATVESTNRTSAGQFHMVFKYVCQTSFERKIKYKTKYTKKRLNILSKVTEYAV